MTRYRVDLNNETTTRGFVEYASNDSSKQTLVVGPGTNVCAKLPLELAAKLYWRVRAGTLEGATITANFAMTAGPYSLNFEFEPDIVLGVQSNPPTQDIPPVCEKPDYWGSSPHTSISGGWNSGPPSVTGGSVSLSVTVDDDGEDYSDGEIFMGCGCTLVGFPDYFWVEEEPGFVYANLAQFIRPSITLFDINSSLTDASLYADDATTTVLESEYEVSYDLTVDDPSFYAAEIITQAGVTSCAVLGSTYPIKLTARLNSSGPQSLAELRDFASTPTGGFQGLQLNAAKYFTYGGIYDETTGERV